MAVSSTFNTSNQFIKWRIELITNSQNIANNTSNITVKVYYWRTNTGYQTYGWGTQYCTIAGTQYSQQVTANEVITENGEYLFSQTLNVAHNSDGTKSITVSAYLDHNMVTASSQSYTFTLATIPRATTPTTSGSYTMGGVLTISTAGRASTSFTHNLYYSWGSSLINQTIATGVTTSYAWTIPKTLAAYIMASSTGTLQIRCVTYSGGTNVGEKNINVTISVPTTSEFNPVVNSVSIAEANSMPMSRYVVGHSALNITVSATGGMYNGSRNSYPVSAKVVVDGITYTKSLGASASTTWTIKTSLLTGAGTKSVSVTITDSRGRTASKTASYTAYAYELPQITSATFERCNSSGTVVSDGIYLKCTLKTNISSIDNTNAKTYKIYYLNGSTEVLIKSGTLSAYANNTLTYYSYSDGVSFSVDNTFTIKAYIYDSFTSSDYTGALSTEATFFDWRKNGKGWAFGKVSEKDGLEIAWKAYDRNDYEIGITEKVIGDGYGHVLYENGFLRQWGTVAITPTAANTVKTEQINFPISYAIRPHISAAPQTNVPHVVSFGVGAGTTAAAALTGMIIYLVRTNTIATTFRWETYGEVANA